MAAPTWRDGAAWLHEPSLWEHATERQRVFIEAVKRTGSMRSAAKELGVHNTVITGALRSARERAAAMGHAPGHFNDGVAPGYRMGKVTVQRANGQVERVWERQHPDQELAKRLFEARVRGLKDELPKAEPVAAPAHVLEDLLTVYPQGDPHCGLYAWQSETGARFDLEEYERVNVAAIDQLVSAAPPSHTALFIDLGDSTHADNNKNRTPRSGHELDVHGRHSEAMRINMRVKRHQINRLLEKHAQIIYRVNPGNHDPETALALAMMLSFIYENEPRVTVSTDPNPYWYLGFGSNLLATCHGDGAKGKDLPLLMATDRPQLWAQSEHGARVWIVGHVHHKDIKDYPGVTVEYTRTLAASDAWSSGQGYRAKRTMEAITYHKTDGEVTRATVGLVQIARAA